MKLSLLGPVGLVAAALALNTGCVTQSAYTLKFNCLDEDGDGAPRSGRCVCLGDPSDVPGWLDCSAITATQPDCDDSASSPTAALRSPDFDEVPYDGIDNDCDDLDLVDVDGDGYPGVVEADWPVDAQADLPYPAELTGKAADCDDATPTTNPGVSETYYDGVDADCDQADDYDRDGDGHALSAALLPTGATPYAGTLPQDDCDDDDSTSFPGTATADVWYDGIDHDCDGANDFDQDGDGYIRAQDSAALVAFNSKYGKAYAVQTDDCDDTPAGQLGVPGDAIYPGATDTWYDAVDADCGDDDDYDRDGDGFVPAAADLPSTAPVYTGLLPDGDCEDGDPAVNPSSLETLGDAVDGDCDEGADTTSFTFLDWTWQTPGRPALAVNEVIRSGTPTRDYALAVAAARFEEPGEAPRTEAAQIFLFSEDAASTFQPPSQVLALRSSSGVGSLAIDTNLAMMAHGGNLYAVTGHDAGSVHALTAYRYAYFPSFDIYNVTTDQHLTGFDVPSGYSDVDILRDPATGSFWVLGCESEALHYMKLEPTSFFVAGGMEAAEPFDPSVHGASSASVCLLEANATSDPTAAAYLDAGGIQEFSLTASDITPLPIDLGRGAYEVFEARHNGDLTILSGGDANAGEGFTGVEVFTSTTEERFLSAETIVSADAAVLGGTLYLAAVEAGPPAQVRLIYGDPSGPLTDVTLPFEHPTLDVTPTHVALAASEDRVWVAVSALNASSGADAVGWAWFAR